MIVAAVLAIPALVLPSDGGDGRAASLMLAAAAALVVVIEYGARVPSMADFRFAPPVNRLRFALVAAVLLSVTACLATPGAAFPFAILGDALDFAYSPARMAADSFTRPSALGPDPMVQRAAATALAVSGLCTLVFAGWIRSGRWPADPLRFNPSTNLPTFEQPSGPAGGRETARRLRLLGWQVIVTAVALLFALLVLGRLAAEVLEPQALQSPLVVAWCATIWAAAPGALVLRGTAILRIARLSREWETA